MGKPLTFFYDVLTEIRHDEPGGGGEEQGEEDPQGRPAQRPSPRPRFSLRAQPAQGKVHLNGASILHTFRMK